MQIPSHVTLINVTLSNYLRDSIKLIYLVTSLLASFRGHRRSRRRSDGFEPSPIPETEDIISLSGCSTKAGLTPSDRVVAGSHPAICWAFLFSSLLLSVVCP